MKAKRLQQTASWKNFKAINLRGYLFENWVYTEQKELFQAILEKLKNEGIEWQNLLAFQQIQLKDKLLEIQPKDYMVDENTITSVLRFTLLSEEIDLRILTNEAIIKSAREKQEKAQKDFERNLKIFFSRLA